MLLKEQYDYRLKTIEDRLEHQEQFMNKKINHLEDRIRSINIIYDRIDELAERINLLHTLFDKLKENFDAKLMSQDDKITNVNSKINKLKSEDIQYIYNLIKKASTTSKELSQEMQNIKTKDIVQSEVLYKQELKQSKILGERLQSPLINQRNDTYQKTDRIRSITLEKDKGQDLKGKQENLEQDQNQNNSKSIMKTDTQKLIDKYQFTLQNKGENDNTQIKIDQQRLSYAQSEGGTNIEQIKLLTTQQQFLLERTISQDHIPKSKYLNCTNQTKEQLKNLRK
ncbi:unnamed protein product [Paramecium sonneborni]|uniref:Uncharacterized protein n=1 Tax=Paramecium sonneborni TaxID=65129 RepID=A0A8S1PMR6_9CILI|nr:unnamed protein product [Paramecium sonneborni]